MIIMQLTMQPAARAGSFLKANRSKQRSTAYPLLLRDAAAGTSGREQAYVSVQQRKDTALPPAIKPGGQGTTHSTLMPAHATNVVPSDRQLPHTTHHNQFNHI